MTWGAVAGGVIAGVGAIAASSNSAGAASDAASAQVGSSLAAQQQQQNQYNMTRADQAPFRNTGVAANRRLGQLLGIGGNDQQASLASRIKEAFPQYFGSLSDTDTIKNFTDSSNIILADPFKQETYLAPGQLDVLKNLYGEIQKTPQATATAGTGDGTSDYGSLLRKFSAADMQADPVYQSGLKFGLDQGVAGINSRAVASGMNDSGATLKALTRFGNDYGSTKANESYNRFTNDQNSIYNKLAGVSGGGQQATNQIQAAGANAANNISNLQTGIGNAQAAGIVGGANAWGSGLQNLNGIYNNYQNSQILNGLLNKNSGGTSYNTGSGVGGWYDPTTNTGG